MNEDKIIEIFVQIDDFIQLFDSEIKQLRLEAPDKAIRNRKSALSDSEYMTILIYFQLSKINDFKSFYTLYLSKYCKDLFPNLISYERFVQSSAKVMVPLMVFLKTNALGSCRGISFIDSTTVKVCHIKGEKQHKVMKGIASKGKSTMGWFFGFKLHLIINDKGELLSFYLAKANVDDRDWEVISKLTENIFGKLFGDRGYISQKLANYLWNDGIDFVYKLRKNMKQQNLSDADKIILRKRALIEPVNDELKNICSIEHSRHRSPKGFIINLVAALAAYHFLPQKPSLNIKPVYDNSKQLLIAA